MPYIVIHRPPVYQQITLDDILGGEVEVFDEPLIDESSTITHWCARVPERFKDAVYINSLVMALIEFTNKHKMLYEVPRNDLYTTFYIPKHSGGMRRIDAPKPELKEALYELKGIFEDQFKALYHTSAFAYVPGRSTIDAVKRHQKNNSRWFFKSDFHNFFGSTTPEFLFKMLSMVWPFSEVSRLHADILQRALDLCFLNGGLPQGTPISPMLTNIMMIPFDFQIARELRKEKFVYTRYADDILISHQYDFKPEKIERIMADTLRDLEAPFGVNPTKTRYASSSGSNWNLGVMLNKDNKITIGYRKKKQLKATICSYILDRKNGRRWDKSDVQVFQGQMAWYLEVEPDGVRDIIDHYNQKFGVKLADMIAEDLRA